MSKAGSKSWRRWLAANLAWTLALLLATNAAWGLWAAFGFDDPEDAPQLAYGGVGEDLLSDNRVLVVLENLSATRARYSTWIHSLEGILITDSVAETMPAWLVPYCGRDGSLLKGKGFEWCAAECVGWPLRLLWVGAYCEDSVVTRLPASGVRLRASTDAGNLSRLDGVIPLRPIWTGQLAYGTFWFAIAALIRVICSAMRKALRRRRAARWRCTNCNYDLHANTSGVCPECGVEFHGDTA